MADTDKTRVTKQSMAPRSNSGEKGGKQSPPLHQTSMDSVDGVIRYSSPISPQDITTLCAAIEGSEKPVRIIDLHGLDIGPENCKRLVHSLAKGPVDQVEYVGLDWNNIGDDGVKCVAENLLGPFVDSIPPPIPSQGHKNLPLRLREINLGANKITAKGAFSLKSSLLSNKSLTTLKIHINPLEQKGYAVIASIIRHTRTLTMVQLSGYVETKCGYVLSEALRQNHSVTRLELGRSHTKEMNALLERNQKITSDFLNAARQGCWPDMKSCLDQGVSYLATTEAAPGVTVGHTLLQGGHKEVFEQLLAYLEHRDPLEKIVLLHAVTGAK